MGRWSRLTAPNDNARIGPVNFRRITDDATQLLTDHIVYIDTTAKPVTYTLLPYKDCPGRALEIHKETADSNPATVAAAPGQNINKKPNTVLNRVGCVRVRSNALS